MRFLTAIVILIQAVTLGCTSRSFVSEQYLELAKNPHIERQTAVVFLIDGLGYNTLKEQLVRRKLPRLENFFLKTGASIASAQAAFPSVTYTNIAGLLQEAPVHETNAVGNKLIFQNQLIDFESLADRKYFSEMLRNKTIFSRLKKQNWVTVSLDYGLGSEATIASGFDLQSGYAASQMDYRYLDRKKIDGLQILLTETDPKQWPDFIFVHLVGLDFLSHRFGPDANEALDYLAELDQQLEKIYSLLKKAESRKKIVTLLTADHGFNRQKMRYFNIESAVRKIDVGLRVINESRFAGIFYLKEPDLKTMQITARQLLQTDGAEIVAYKNKDRIYIKSKVSDINYSIDSNDFVPPAQTLFYPYFLANMTSYFKATKSADMVVIPDPRTVYSRSGLGFHGGPTRDEVLVPVLMRNARFTEEANGLPSWKLLQFIGK